MSDTKKGTMVKRVLINVAHGGFRLSEAAFSRLKELGCKDIDCSPPWDTYTGRRDNPLLLQVFDELGDEASGDCCCLGVVEIPDRVKYYVHEYDGREWIGEGRMWDEKGQITDYIVR